MQFSNLSESTGSLLEEGEYTCKVTNVTETLSKKGDGMWNVELTVVSGPNAGRKVFDNLTNSQAAKFRFKNFFDALGLDTSGIFEMLPGSVIGKQCLVNVEHKQEEYQGQVQTKARVTKTGYRMIEKDPAPF